MTITAAELSPSVLVLWGTVVGEITSFSVVLEGALLVAATAVVVAGLDEVTATEALSVTEAAMLEEGVSVLED